MKPKVFFPDRRYYRAMGLSIALILLAAMFWWSIPAASVLLAEVMDLALAVAIVVVAHLALLYVALAMGAAYVRRLRYEIYDDEVIIHAGVITKSVKHVPYRAVTNLKVTRGPVERMFGLGTLHIETAGLSGQNTGAEGTLSGLGDVDAVYRIVTEELHRFRSGLAPTQAGSDVPANGHEAEMLAALLDEVRAIRSRLDDEPDRPMS